MPALSKLEIPLQRDVVPRELRGEFRNVAVQHQHTLIGGIGFICDRDQQGEPVLAEQRSLRLVHELIRNVERRQAS